jgi:DNA-binding CsgD family transcriptional regulator
MTLKKLVYLILLIIASFPLKALEIKGTIQLQADWHPVVFLASLNSPENLFVASPDFVIAETFIQPDGSFTIQTSSIPEDARFYRLYLVKGNNSSVEFNTSIHRNFIHLILDQNSNIIIDAKVEDNTLSINKLAGSDQNNTILDFDKEISKRKQQFTFNITKTKNEYLTKGLEDFIRNFVKNEENTLVGLYALYHLEEKDTDFLRNSEFYFSFQKRIKEQYPGAPYTQSYTELLEKLIGFRDMVCEMPGVQPRWKDNLLIAQSILILILLFVIIINSRKKLVQLKEKISKSQGLFANLTLKEREILKLLAEGKTNKEIAQELYVELSTVKTHINSIYKQLQLSSRKEAVVYYQDLDL